MNKLKNEHVIKLGEKEILLRPTFSALANVESAVGALAHLAWKFAASKTQSQHAISFTQIAQIIYFCQANTKADGKPEYSLEEVWEMMQGHGCFKAYAEIVIFISKVSAGDKTAPELSESVKKN